MTQDNSQPTTISCKGNGDGLDISDIKNRLASTAQP